MGNSRVSVLSRTHLPGGSDVLNEAFRLFQVEDGKEKVYCAFYIVILGEIINCLFKERYFMCDLALRLISCSCSGSMLSFLDL